MAITQRDIKKVLAYSTLSQLGYMTMALGAGAYTAAMFHLTTHAFFKALLFMCAGSVIHGCHHEQDMFKMGGLPQEGHAQHVQDLDDRHGRPDALILPIAGWWSKDEILGAYVGTGRIWGAPILLILGLVVAFMTAFYMFRATYLTFHGKYRGHHEAHESPKVMTRPLWVLAIFSIFIGFVGIPNNVFGGQSNIFESFLHDWHEGANAELHWSLAIISTLIALTGVMIAKKIYAKSAGRDPLPQKLGRVWTLWSNLYYIDAFYLFLVKKVQQGIAKVAWAIERVFVIGGLYNGTAQIFRVGGDRLRRVQSGRLGSYITSYAMGTALIAALALAAYALS